MEQSPLLLKYTLRHLASFQFAAHASDGLSPVYGSAPGILPHWGLNWDGHFEVVCLADSIIVWEWHGMYERKTLMLPNAAGRGQRRGKCLLAGRQRQHTGPSRRNRGSGALSARFRSPIADAQVPFHGALVISLGALEHCHTVPL